MNLNDKFNYSWIFTYFTTATSYLSRLTISLYFVAISNTKISFIYV